MREKVFSFILLFTVWIILAGRLSPDEIIVGIIASLLTTYLFTEMIFRHKKRKFKLTIYIKKGFLILLFIPVFFYEALLSALKVSKYIFRKDIVLSPGIIKVKTKLSNVTAITILANLITLTPGTLTLDFDKAERAYYIHWIDVPEKSDAETGREIIARFERWLEVIFG